MWSPINPQPYVKCVYGSARGRHVVDQKPEGGATGMRGCGLTSGSSIMSILIVVIIVMNHNEHYTIVTICHYNYHAIVIIRLYLSYIYHCVSSFSNILNIILVSVDITARPRASDDDAVGDPPWMVLWPPQIESWCQRATRCCGRDDRHWWFLWTRTPLRCQRWHPVLKYVTPKEAKWRVQVWK